MIFPIFRVRTLAKKILVEMTASVSLKTTDKIFTASVKRDLTGSTVRKVGDIKKHFRQVAFHFTICQRRFNHFHFILRAKITGEPLTNCIQHFDQWTPRIKTCASVYSLFFPQINASYVQFVGINY